VDATLTYPVTSFNTGRCRSFSGFAGTVRSFSNFMLLNWSLPTKRHSRCSN